MPVEDNTKPSTYTKWDYRAYENVEPYKGVPIDRDPAYLLYRVIPKADHDVVTVLAGSFTDLPTLWKQVDKFYTENPKAKAEDIYQPRNAPKRGRPKGSYKKHKQESLLNEPAR